MEERERFQSIAITWSNNSVVAIKVDVKASRCNVLDNPVQTTLHNFLKNGTGSISRILKVNGGS